MKKIFFTIVLISLNLLSFSQYGGIIDYEKNTWSEVKQNKIYVVFEEAGNSKYDKSLKKAVETYWKFSGVEFITYNKYETLQKDESKFFLISVGLTTKETGRWDQKLSYIYLVRGYKKGAKKGDISKFKQLAAIQTGDDARSVYIPILIKNLNRSAERVHSGEIKSIAQSVDLIKAQKGNIKKSPLNILEVELNEKIKSAEDIKADYVGEVAVVSEEELTKSIYNNEDINVFLTGRSATKSWVHVYNLKSGEELFTSYNLINKKWPAGIIPYHFKKWNK